MVFQLLLHGLLGMEPRLELVQGHLKPFQFPRPVLHFPAELHTAAVIGQM